jgi:E1A/CREB-binding protein
MKRLWKHITKCKDQKCLEQHCCSSRYVLIHYRSCKDFRCQICYHVRKAVQRSHENQRWMQA